MKIFFSVYTHTVITAFIGMSHLDTSFYNNSKYLYVLNAGSQSIGVYAVSNDGDLNGVQNLPGLPAGATGLAAK